MKKVQVVVKEGFLDKYTGLFHKENDKLEITDARFREINRNGVKVEAVKASAKKEK